jgi:HK97 family phage major capsid protein
MADKKKKRTDSGAAPDEQKLLIRAATIETRADGDGEPVVTMSVSSEEPVLTYLRFGDQWMYAYEILDHGKGSINMARAKDGLVILDRHYGDQVGLMDVSVDNGKMRGPVQFCSGQRAQNIGADAAKGLRKNVSVGYTVQKYVADSEGERDGYPVVRAVKWTPHEASFEPVPADVTVGVGRAANTKPAGTPAQTKEREIMDPKEMAALFARAAQFGIDADKVQSLDLTDGDKARAALDALIVERQQGELKTVRAEIEQVKERKPEAKPAVRTDTTPVAPLGGDIKTEQKIVRKYSVLNVLRHSANITHDAHGRAFDIGFEREIEQECRKAGMGSSKRGGQFIIPHAVLASRDFTVSGTSSATVATDLYSQEFIDLLRSKMILGDLGVRFMTGLVGNVAIPKMSAGATGYWVAESGDITESEPTLGQVTGTPHTCGVLTDISRRLLLQSTPDAEMLVRDEILARIARTVQIAVFAGTGADGQPSAITNASGINNPSVTQGTPTHAEILNFVADIMTDNADSGGMKWAMTAEVWAKLADTDVDSGSGLKVLDYKSKTVVGYPYVAPCSDLPANSLWFGNWAAIMIGIWGAGIDLNMDTATLSSSGGLRIVGLQDVDVMVRNGESIAYNTAVTS